MTGGAIIYDLVIAGAIATPLIFAVAWFMAKARRKSLVMIAAVLALPYLAAIYAFMIEPETLVVRHVTVPSARWTGAPLRIGVISDLHVGGVHVPPSRVAKVVARMNAEKPDVVILLGDYVDGHLLAEHRHPKQRDAIEHGLAELARLSTPGGVYGVIGNHDMFYDQPEVTRVLTAAGVRVLSNDSWPIRGGRAWIAGIGEYSWNGANYPLAESRARKDAPLIVAMHWPDSIYDIDQRPLLTLAGHSHCTQLGVPVLNLLMAASRASRRYRCGLYDVDGKALYVSGGVGTSILPMRFLAPPEIAVVTLSAR
jgi:predicted MPP superfamily phosphohydrolase